MATIVDICYVDYENISCLAELANMLPQWLNAQDLSERLLYSLDDRGRFLVISSINSHYLYVLELTTTQGHQAPDAFSRMFCYPMKSGLFDLSICNVSEEENIQGRYQVNLRNFKLNLAEFLNAEWSFVIFD